MNTVHFPKVTKKRELTYITFACYLNTINADYHYYCILFAHAQNAGTFLKCPITAAASFLLLFFFQRMK